jgi:hypothetical protein
MKPVSVDKQSDGMRACKGKKSEIEDEDWDCIQTLLWNSKEIADNSKTNHHRQISFQPKSSVSIRANLPQTMEDSDRVV